MTEAHRLPPFLYLPRTNELAVNQTGQRSAAQGGRAALTPSWRRSAAPPLRRLSSRATPYPRLASAQLATSRLPHIS
eukprot:5380349-Pleurochrysis_carterae.AAC.2